MIVFLAALAVTPWAHPLAFRPMPGWQTGASGNRPSRYGRPGKQVARPEESAAWAAMAVRYSDDATADPPNKTLAHLPPNGVLVWAVIYTAATRGQAPIRLVFDKAKRFD